MPPKFQRNDQFKQGVFKPKNPKKFLGKYAVFRSSYELKFFRWADENPNVLEWGSESVIVPYVSPIDGKVHRYYVDSFMAIREGDVIKKYLIELKPSKQMLPPKVTKNKRASTLLYEQQTYIKNTAKWAAAREYAKKKGLEFIIITEKELFHRE